MSIGTGNYHQSTVQLAEACKASGAYWPHCHQALEQYGVTSICHLSLPFKQEANLRGVSQAALFKTSHPKEWQSAVGQQSLDYDLSVELITTGTQVVFWHEIRHGQSFSKIQHQLNEAELDLGMNVGVSVMARQFEASGGITGVGLCFADMKPEEFRRIWAEHADRITDTTRLLDAGLIDNGLSEVIGLAPRECEVLCYLAAGYRVADIAKALHKSPKTIEKYVDSAKLKLKASTRDNAIAKALVLNLLEE